MSSSGAAVEVEFSNNSTFTTNFFNSTINYADLVALIDPDAHESLTFQDLQDRTINFIQNLQENGVLKGDIIGTFCGNSTDYLIFCLAANQIGAIICPLNPAYKIGEFEHYFLQAKINWILTENDYIKKIKTSKTLVKSVNGIIMLPNSTSKDVVKQRPPKAIVLSQKSLNAYLILLNTLKSDPNENFVTLSNKDTVYGGLLTTLLMLAQGAKVLINRKFHEDEFLENITKYEVSVLLLVSPILEFLCYAPKVDPTKLSTIQYIFVGAAKVRSEHEAGIIKRLPYLNKVLQLYGSTEAGVLVFMMPQKVSSTKVGSTGLPLPGVEAKVSESPSLEYSANYSYGELLLKTTTQMSRYLNEDSEEDSESLFDEEGFMKTGDLVRVDSDGYYYIVGRLKELIKVRGWQVSPYELEEALRNRFDAIMDIGIVGLPADCDGEQPTAVVVLAPGTMLSAGEIEQYVEDSFVSYKKLVGGVHFVDSLPTSPSGKLDRKELLRWFLESHIYEDDETS
uniref:Uncharacterized protein n=1 Tax=Panagrolaimus sp. PS1159 TaxID=55785 RepID=A0AC35FAB1_9BILA